MNKKNSHFTFSDKNWDWFSDNNFACDGAVSISGGLFLLWATIDQIRTKYNIATLSGRVGLTAWWLMNGVKEYPVLNVTVNYQEKLFEPNDVIQRDDDYPVSRIALATGELNDALMSTINLSVVDDRIRLVNWYYEYAVKGRRKITEYELKYFFSVVSDIKQDTNMPITRAMMLYWRASKDVQKKFDMSTKEERLRFERWWYFCGYKNAAPYVLPGQEIATGTNQDTGQAWTQENVNSISYDECVTNGYLAGGLNLIGLAKGELGIGEDVRMAARAMGVAHVQFSIFNFPKNSFSRQKDESLAQHINENLIYNVNMVNLTGFEHSSLFSTYGNKFFDKRFTIGAWPWELPIWPRVCNGAFNLVDEVWASSSYTADAYSHSPVPVVHMPMAVDFDSVPDYARSEFGLPADSYLFLYVFDSLSYMARKNPVAHLEAFWRAFPRTCSDVGLVVKTMNADFNNETWNTFNEMVASDNRIFLITETLSKNKILGLMNSCNAFVSLHRAEGFGRCIAEMMWLGKPVITTNFSGNTDFTTEKTSFLVDGPLVVVKQGEYPYSENQYWCDPDIEQASYHMRVCYENGENVNKIAIAGKKVIKENYSFDAVARKYTERLNYLGVL